MQTTKIIVLGISIRKLRVGVTNLNFIRKCRSRNLFLGINPIKKNILHRLRLASRLQHIENLKEHIWINGKNKTIVPNEV